MLKFQNAGILTPKCKYFNVKIKVFGHKVYCFEAKIEIF
jgi:hypothetical protein